MKLLLTLSLLFATPSFAAGLCNPGETIYFSCTAKGNGKEIAVCGGADWVQYRFGKPGSVELEFPAERKGSLTKFTGADRYHKADSVSGQWLMFERSGIEYSVAQIQGGSNFTGVSVSLPKAKKPIDIACDFKAPSVRKLQDVIPLVPEGNP